MDVKTKSELLVVADDYLTAVCELVVRAKDATSEARLVELTRALNFARRIIDDRAE